MRVALFVCSVCLLITQTLHLPVAAQGPKVSSVPQVFSGQAPDDRRTGELKTLNGYFPFQSVANKQQWLRRQKEIQRRILVSQGLWPMPTRSPLNAVIHGRVERDDYVVDRVYFESIPGHYVTGSLYRPKNVRGRIPAILSPHGHWSEGRFYDAGPEKVQQQIEVGAERFPIGGRYPIQARAVHLARMGCMVFVYDMTGNADSIQLPHRPSKWEHLDKPNQWGFMSVQADLRLQNMMGLQTWNSIRAIDFLLELDQTDPERIGVTGASGGGTQSMVIGAIDPRIAAAMPCVMVSTAMQGGCTCENAPLLRIDQGNVDIAAAIAPRPLGLTAADDWTIELQRKGYPDLLGIYEMMGKPEHLTAVFHTQFPHNYNYVNRAAMYDFFQRHFGLGSGPAPEEQDFKPLSREEATVWTEEHPAPSGDAVGDSHEVRMLEIATADSQRKMQQQVPTTGDQWAEYEAVVGGGWQTIIGRTLADYGEVTFAETSQMPAALSDDSPQATVRAGRLEHSASGQQLPAFWMQPSVTDDSRADRKGVVIYVADDGKQGVFKGGGLASPVKELLQAGWTVLAADLIGQGEFISPQQSWENQPMWFQRGGDQGWHRFSGYTYGYNHCLFAKRVHDVLALIRYASIASGRPVRVVSSGAVAGPIVAGACSQASQAVERAVVHLDGFQFAEVTRHDDPMFVPGSVKYLDIDGLVSLAAPTPLKVIASDSMPVSRAVYEAAGATEQLEIVDQPLSDAEWLQW